MSADGVGELAAGHESAATLLYRIALLAFPRSLRNEYGMEMRHTFGREYQRRRELGGGAARRYLGRAWADALLAGMRERSGGGVHRPLRPAPRPGARQCGESIGREIAADLRQALRALRASPAFTVTVLVVLALGVGVNGALFSAIRATVLASAPYPQPERLAMLDLTLGERDSPEPGRTFPWSYPKYQILEARAQLPVQALAAYARRSLSLTGRGDAARLSAEVVSPAYFEVLGVAPTLGHWLGIEDAAGREVVLGHSLWRDRFAADPAVVGAQVILNEQPMVVAGVAAAGFRGLSGGADLWVPMQSVPHLVSPTLLGNADGHWLRAIGRLREGATLEQLDAQVQSAALQVEQTYPWDDPAERVGGSAAALDAARRNPRAQEAVAVVGVAAALVLLIGCANLAALMLARGSDRQRDIAVRLALGGSRLRVMRGLIVEICLLSLGGGLLGLIVTSQATAVMARVWPAALSRGGWNLAFVDRSQFQLDTTIVAYTMGLALVTGFLFSLGPALRLTSTDLALAMREGAKATRARLASRRVLVAAEIGLALVLVVGAVLMSSSLGRLLAVEQGFDAARLLKVEYVLPRSHVEAEQPAAFHERVIERLRALPGVDGAALGTPPFDGHPWITSVERAGDRHYEIAERPYIGVSMVTEDYFAVLGIALRSGRVFESNEGADSPAVVVINQAAAAALFPGSDPIGQVLSAGVDLIHDGNTGQIIGVVDNVLYDPPAFGFMPEAYLLHRQEPGRDTFALLRTRGEPFDVLPSVRAAIAGLDPNLPLYGITTIEDLGAAQVGDTKLIADLLSLFSALAIALACTGMWGIVAYAVTGRAREIGIRMALGAQGREVIGLVLRQGFRSAVAGVAIGAIGAILLARRMASLLYEVQPHDPTAFLTAAAALLFVSLLAAYLPARRASQLDPVATLRTE